MKKVPINDLTFEYVKSRLHYDPLTGLFLWKLKSPECGEYFWRKWNTQYGGKCAGSKLNIQVGGSRRTYWRLHLASRDYLAHRIAWLLHYGEWPTNSIDHINGDSTDNRIANLRDCTHAQNHANRSADRGNSTGYKGVSLHACGRYYAQLKKGGEHKLALTYATAEEAARAYDAAAREHFGEFARLNFPDEGGR
jgi:hypothetical protein